jgi:hypothetical protein
MVDLARELAAAAADGSMPILALDRVWITRAGQALLLDFPAPGLADGRVAGAADAIADPQRFLARVASHALGTGQRERPGHPPRGPLPRQAHSVLDTLERSGFASMTAAAEQAAALMLGPEEVTRARRAASILLTNVPLLAALIALSVGLPTVARLLQTDFLTLGKALVGIRALEGKSDEASVRKREALEVFVADRFRAELADDRTWRDPYAAGLLMPLKPVASRVLSSRRTLTDDERRAAHATAAAELGSPVALRSQAIGISTILPAVVLLLSAFAGVVSAFLFRGGLLLRLLGLAVVGERGADVSRLRATARAAVAWSPVLLLWAYVWAQSVGGRDVLDAFSDWWVPAAAAAAALLGSAWAVLHPGRGLPDRLTRTYLVPR